MKCAFYLLTYNIVAVVLSLIDFCVSSVQQWAVSFGKEIAALSARYSGTKLLQKVSNHAEIHQPIHTRAFMKTGGYTSAAVAFIQISHLMLSWH